MNITQIVTLFESEGKTVDIGSTSDCYVVNGKERCIRSMILEAKIISRKLKKEDAKGFANTIAFEEAHYTKNRR